MAERHDSSQLPTPDDRLGDHYIPELAQDPDSDPGPDLAEGPASRSGVLRGCGTMVLVFIVAAVGVGALLGGLVWAYSVVPITVPNVVGRRQPLANAQIKAANLTTGTVGDVATTDFESGVVVTQQPAGHSEVALGTRVNMALAVAPTPVAVPDLSFDYQQLAEATLAYSLLRPAVYLQLSDTVPFGRVVAQMPRAGQTVMTGQQVAVFISLGQGTGGAVVPSVLGKTSSQAATDIAQVYLVPKWLDAAIGEQPQGTVVDQVPAPGTRVPVGSAVPIITTDMAN